MARIRIGRTPFGSAPNSLLEDSGASWKAKGLYAYIQSQAEGWDFAIERMPAKDGKDSTRSGIKELERLGFLERLKTRKSDGTFEIEYVLHWEPKRQGQAENHGGKPATANDPSMAENPTAENPTAENPTAENPPCIQEESNKKNLTKRNKQEETLAEFSEFWKHYPKKTAKAAAEKCWAKMAAKERDEAIEALPKHSRAWASRFGMLPNAKYPTTYVPHASTWLNGKRWLDAVELYDPGKRPDGSRHDGQAEKTEAQKEREERAREAERIRKEREEEEKRAADEKKREAAKAYYAMDDEKKARIREEAAACLPPPMQRMERTNPDTYKRFLWAKVLALVSKYQ